MPIYEYHCAACEKIGEYLQKIADPTPEACRFCGEGPLQKKVSQSAFVLKGGGWYVTDFRDGGKKKPTPKADSATDATSAESKSADSSSTSSGDASAAPTGSSESSEKSDGKKEAKKEAKTDSSKSASTSTD